MKNNVSTMPSRPLHQASQGQSVVEYACRMYQFDIKELERSMFNPIFQKNIQV